MRAADRNGYRDISAGFVCFYYNIVTQMLKFADLIRYFFCLKGNSKRRVREGVTYPSQCVTVFL